MLKLNFGRTGATILAIAANIWLGAKILLDAIGYSTAPEDFEALKQKLPLAIEWLLSTPWWVPAVLATALTAFLIWVSWPRSRALEPTSVPTSTADDGNSNLSNEQIERLIWAISRASNTSVPELREWADERTSHVTRIGDGHYLVLFRNKVRCIPTLMWLEPVPGDHPEFDGWSDIGFTVKFRTRDADIRKLRFFADAYAEEPEHDPLEDALNGRWYGDRFIFKEPKTILNQEGMFTERMTVSAAPCPKGAIAEIQYDITPRGRYPRLSIGGGSFNGAGVRECTLNDEVSFDVWRDVNYPDLDTDQEMDVKLTLLGWFKRPKEVI